MLDTLPYGSWPSPLAAADIAGHAPRLGGARFVGDDIWWAEGIASERGRTAILSSASTEPVLPAPWSARSRVHEYGGGAWTTLEGTLLFVEQSDQRVYRLVPGGIPEALTPDDPQACYGDLTLGEGMLWAVRERDLGESVPTRDIVTIPLTPGEGEVRSVVAGSDFLAAPAPHRGRLAWIAWNHPDMPWDAAELRVGDLDSNGTVSTWQVVAGGRGDAPVSALQPTWTPAGDLLFLADPPGPGQSARWNLHLARSGSADQVACVRQVDADTGGGLWNLGARWYSLLETGQIVAIETQGRDRLVLIDGDIVAELETPLVHMQLGDTLGSRVLLTGAGATTPGGIWLLDIAEKTVTAIRGGHSTVDAAWLPTALPLTVDGPDGPVHAFAYPPTNPEVTGPDDERPPYLVLAHGGPTAHVSGELSLQVAYFTSRGIGVLDVNYGGSTGYGREYRDRLRGRWGVADVADVAAAARGLAEAGLADPARLAIKGGSAGGWTVLCAIADTDVFSAGVSRYGVADLRLLAAETHDFEARYLDGLVGPLPECEQVYIDRSPLSRPESLTTPLLILQGADDPVVPPSQSEALRDALAANGTPHAYLLFPGESHGFRGAEAIIRSLEAELAFLGSVFDFLPVDIPALELSGGDAQAPSATR